MSERNGLFVDYCAKDFLDGTQLLDPWEELAYRRVVDMIYATNDSLPDDDRKLAWTTKTGARWKAIKAALVSTGKLVVEEGRITNLRCQKMLEKSARKIVQTSAAGKASSAAGKSRKNLKQHRTAVTTDDRTDDRTTHLPKEPIIPPISPRNRGDLASQNGEVKKAELLAYTEPWEQRVRAFRQTGFWINEWGCRPGVPGSVVPVEFLLPAEHPKKGNRA